MLRAYINWRSIPYYSYYTVAKSLWFLIDGMVGVLIVIELSLAIACFWPLFPDSYSYSLILPYYDPYHHS